MQFALIQAAAPEGLTLARVLADIPHDPSAIFVYLLTAVSIWLISRGSRTRDGDSTSRSTVLVADGEVPAEGQDQLEPRSPVGTHARA